MNRFLGCGEEGLEDRRRENGCPKVDLDLLEALVQLIGKCPQDFGYIRPTWTQELLAIVLAVQTGVIVSPRTVSRMLERLNARWGRPCGKRIERDWTPSRGLAGSTGRCPAKRG